MLKLPAHVAEWHYKSVSVCGTDVGLLSDEDTCKHLQDRQVFTDAVWGPDRSDEKPIGFRIKNPVGLLAIDPDLNALAQLAVRSGKKSDSVFELFTHLLILLKIPTGKQSHTVVPIIREALKERYTVESQHTHELSLLCANVVRVLRRLTPKLLLEMPKG
jgi:hypothetical protein